MKIVRRAVATLLVCAAATVVGSSPATAYPGDAAGIGAAVPVPEGVTASWLLAGSSGFGPAWRVDGGKIVSLTA